MKVEKTHLIKRVWTNHNPPESTAVVKSHLTQLVSVEGFKSENARVSRVVRVWPLARCSLQDSPRRYLWWCLHFLSWTAPTRSDTQGLCWQVSQVLSRARGWRLVMNKEWQIHERFSRVCPEILDSAFMSSAISSAFSHGWGWWWDSWHFC